jgi:flagellin-like hook-associated protein FlgL
VGLSVNTNIAAMNAYRNLSTTNSQMSKSLERLSSGYRINRAADDAAGLAISEGLRSQIGGLTQAVRNTQDGTSVVQTAEGALSETTSILQRMRDLSVQASNSGSLNSTATASIQKEISQLKSELDRISSTTTFNGTKLLDGKFASNFQVGANAGETINVTIGTAMGSTGLGVGGVDVTAVGQFTAASASGTASTVFASAAGSANGSKLVITAASADTFGASATRSTFTSLTGTITFAGKSLDLASVDYSSIAASATGSTFATAATAVLNSAAASVWGSAGSAAFSVTGTGATQHLDFTGFQQTGYTASGNANAGTTGGVTTAEDIANASVSFAAGSGATGAITAIDTAITTVSSIRADLGAKQNRFEHTINNLNTAIENTTASESRIRDTDMAAEMTKFTRAQVLTQAGTAMLAQANQSTQSILKLLG